MHTVYRIRYALNTRLSALSEDTLVNYLPLCKRGAIQTHRKSDVTAVARVRIRSELAHRWSVQTESASKHRRKSISTPIRFDSARRARKRAWEKEKERDRMPASANRVQRAYDLIKFNMARSRPLATDRIRDHAETSTTPERHRACSYTA